MPLPGDPIIIRVQMADGATNKYPLAHVFDTAGNAELAGSPIALTHIALGLYGNNGTLAYPASTRVRMQIVVYDDSGHTQVDAVEGDANDNYVQVDIGTSANVGDPIYASLQLINGDATVYVAAHYYDGTGAEVSGSPVHLTHVARGLYVDNGTIEMPNTPLLAVQYKVFTDAGYSVPSTVDADSLDLVFLSGVPPTIVALQVATLIGLGSTSGILIAEAP